MKKFSKHLVVIATIALASCSSTSTPSPSLTMNSVSMYATPDANQNSALAVDLVIVYNSNLMGTLNQMSAKTYFASSKQLLLDNPTLLDIWHWELVPGQMVQNFQPPQNKGEAFGAYVFANYQTPGDHRLRVTPDGIVNIILMKDDLKNLSTLSANDIQNGTTMTNPACWGDSSDGNLKQGSTNSNNFCDPNSSQGFTKLGPAVTIAQPCTQVVPQPCPQVPKPCAQVVPQPCTQVAPPSQIPPCGSTSSSGQGPIPIVAQPLPPLKVRSSSTCAPCNSKRK
ncbi:MAG: hypothetical protein HYX35_07010 [Proteobacteria bacterium]|nr:hypothetical protein [Pseudomonadota bacterium]